MDTTNSNTIRIDAPFQVFERITCRSAERNSEPGSGVPKYCSRFARSKYAHARRCAAAELSVDREGCSSSADDAGGVVIELLASAPAVRQRILRRIASAAASSTSAVAHTLSRTWRESGDEGYNNPTHNE